MNESLWSQAEYTRLLAQRPLSHEQFREIMCAYLSKRLAVPVAAVTQQFFGYRYSPQGLAAILEARDELLRRLLQGETLFSAKAQAEEITGIRAHAAAADPKLQAFLKSVQKKRRTRGKR